MNRKAPRDSSDRARIRRAFEKLDCGAVVALADVGNTQTFGHEIAREHAERRGLTRNEYSTIFWHKQSSDAFDRDGNLVGALLVHWSGDKKLLSERLKAELADYVVAEPDSSASAFKLSRALSVGLPSHLDEAETLRYLHVLLTRSGTGLPAETQAYLKELVRVGSERLAIFAAYLLGPTFEPATIETILTRADELALFGRRAGVEIYQTPDHTFSRVLTSMRQIGHPDYQLTVSRWSNHRKVVFRRAAADHADEDTVRLTKLVCDKDPTVRVFALRSLIGSVLTEHRLSPAERRSALGRLVDLIAIPDVYTAAHEECRLEFWHLYFGSETPAETCREYSVRLLRVREVLAAESQRDDLDNILRLLAEPP